MSTSSYVSAVIQRLDPRGAFLTLPKPTLEQVFEWKEFIRPAHQLAIRGLLSPHAEEWRWMLDIARQGYELGLIDPDTLERIERGDDVDRDRWHALRDSVDSWRRRAQANTLNDRGELVTVYLMRERATRRWFYVTCEGGKWVNHGQLWPYDDRRGRALGLGC